MSDVKKQVRMIMCDVDANNNKFWTGTLYDNNDVHVEWGRVGKATQSKLHKGVGEHFLDKKEREKFGKGYTPLKTVATQPGSKTVLSVTQNDLNRIAREQIKTKNPLLNTLIDNLVKANVHRITSSTQIQFDAGTGLFTTPLGVVTKEGIDEARILLADIKSAGNPLKAKVDISNYLRIIPQDIGMKFDVKTMFGTGDALIKQSDLLDSLESSYLALQTPSPTALSGTQTLEYVFNVELDLMSDAKEFKRIEQKFHDTRKSMHTSYRLNIKNVYTLYISSVRANFEIGKKVGNIMELWHGTKKANLLSILKAGLRTSPPSTAAIAGKMFGNGTYFSDQSTKSLNYAYGYWDGKTEKNCFMLLCDVAMGQPYIPKNNWGTFPVPGYHSTFAKASVSGVMNNEMIVYKDNQADIKYLVEFSE